MGRSSAKSSSHGRFCFFLALPAAFVIFMFWDSFRRSTFMGLDATVAQKQILSDVACKVVLAESQGSKDGNVVRFLLHRHPVYTAPMTEGLSVVTIDPWKQVAITTRSYYTRDGDANANNNLAMDLGGVLSGHVVLIAANNFGHKLDDSALKALKDLGSSLTKEDPPKAYVFIGSMRGGVLAESQGATARALAVLPCMSERQSLQPILPIEQQRQLGYTKSEPIPDEVRVTAETKGTDDTKATEVEKSKDASREPKKLQEAAGESERSQVARARPPREQSKPKTKMEEKTSEDVSTSQAKNPQAVLEQSKSRASIDGKRAENESERDALPETTYRCVGGQGDRNCIFRNLYYQHGRFKMFVLKGPSKPIEVKRADKYEGLWKPDIETFSSMQKIEKYVQECAVIEERGLSVQFNPMFHNNIGHGIFDGLYPAFFATVKLKVHDRPWLPVVAVDSACFDDSATGSLKPGDLVEAYLPHSKYGRSLRAVRVQVIHAPSDAGKGAECKWKPGFDHNGLDLGGTPVGDAADKNAACLKSCSLAFGCKVGVLFDNTCYLKGKGGHEFPRSDRPGIKMCKLEGGAPKANVVVKPKAGSEAEMGEVSIPDAWIVGRVRRRCMTEGIYETFGMVGDIRRLFEMERDCRNYPDLLIRFEEIVFGVGGAGNMIADKTGAIGGSLEPHNAMSKFRDRMLQSYGLPVERGVKPVPPDHNLNVIVISNKRFGLRKEDTKAINTVIQKLNEQGGFNAKLINWGAIGGPNNKFREHLKMTQKADVYVSSIGTALQYVPFMQDGKIFVALGSVWMRSGQYFPTFMEQQLAGGGTPYLRTLYADPGGVLRNTNNYPRLGEDGYFAGVNGTLLAELMQNAEVLLRKGFEIPVAPEENLSVEGRIIVDICKRDAEACKNIIHHRNSGHGMALLWNECVVYEVGPWRKGGPCGSTHHKLLRQLRKEYGIPGYGAPES